MNRGRSIAAASAAAALALVLAAAAAPAPAPSAGPSIAFRVARCVRPPTADGPGVDVKYEVEWPQRAASTQALARVRAAIWAAIVLEEDNQEGATPAFDADRALEARAEALHREYLDFRRDFPDSARQWHSHGTARVTFRHPAAVAVRVETDEFTGGAHPNARAIHLVFDPASGRTLGPWDVFLPARSDELLKRIKAAIRKVRGLDERASLEAEGFWEKEIAPRNMSVDARGVVFTNNSYDIACHSMGGTEIRLAWAELEGLLDPDSPLAPLWKESRAAP